MGIIVNGVEFPGVPKGEARLQIKIMTNHTKDDLDILVMAIKEAVVLAKEIIHEIN